MPAVDINLMAVLAAAVLAMAIGFVWYSLSLFGKPWMKEMNLTQKDLENGPGVGYVVAFLASLVQAYVLSHFLSYVGADTWSEGAATGFWLWLGFVATALGVNYIFGQRSFRLWKIDAGYFLALLLAQGALLAVWV